MSIQRQGADGGPRTHGKGREAYDFPNSEAGMTLGLSPGLVK